MTIATAKTEQSSNRYMLVKVTPAKDIGSNLALLSGTTYIGFFDFPNVSKVERNGVALTEVSSPTSNNEYSYDSDTGFFKVVLDSSPDSSNVIVFFFDLFYTGEKTRYASDGIAVRQWNPFLIRYPNVQQSFSNIINGIITTKGSAFSVSNEDGHLNGYSGTKYSFENKEVTFWLGIGDETPEIIYKGFVSGYSLRGIQASFKVLDKMSLLDKTATFGDSPEERVFSTAFAGYATGSFAADPNRIGEEIPIVLGRGNGYQYIDHSKVANNQSATSTPDKKALDIRTAQEAFIIDYESDNTSANEQFIACRIPNGVNIETQTIGSLTRFNTATMGGDTVHLYHFSGHNLQVGQTFEWNDGGGPYRAIVHHVGDFTFSSQSYNVMVGNNADINLSDPPLTSAGQFVARPSIMVCKYNGDTPASFDKNYASVWLKYSDNWTHDISNVTDGGNKLLKIDVGASVNINPSEGDKLFVSVMLDSSLLHGQTCKKLLESAGLSTNAASFTQADLDLAGVVRLQIPEIGQQSADKYRDYLEKLLRGTLGYIANNADGEIEYHVLKAPTAGLKRDEVLVLNNSATVNYNYRDIANELRAINKHTVGSDGGITDAKDLGSQWLNAKVVRQEFENYLEVSAMDVRIADHLKVLPVRVAEYSYSTATEDVDLQLGQDIELDMPKLLDSAKQVKITSISKSVDKTTVKALDLGDL